MKLVSLACKKCGANLDIDMDSKQAFCPYCGEKLMIDDGTININRHIIDEARLREADVRMKELEYQHERQVKLDEEMLRERRTWRLGITVYILAMLLFYSVNTELMVLIMILGGIGLSLLRPKEKTTRISFEQMDSPKSKMTAFVLCFFLGIFGAHYFYVKRPVWGFVFLGTFGFFGIGWFVDLIRILSGSFTDKEKRFLKD